MGGRQRRGLPSLANLLASLRDACYGMPASSLRQAAAWALGWNACSPQRPHALNNILGSTGGTQTSKPLPSRIAVADSHCYETSATGAVDRPSSALRHSPSPKKCLICAGQLIENKDSRGVTTTLLRARARFVMIVSRQPSFHGSRGAAAVLCHGLFVKIRLSIHIASAPGGGRETRLHRCRMQFSLSFRSGDSNTSPGLTHSEIPSLPPKCLHLGISLSRVFRPPFAVLPIILVRVRS